MILQHKGLGEYRGVANGKRLPRYLRSARRTIADVHMGRLSTNELWELHDSPARPKIRSGKSLLDCKIELADRMLSQCTLCERRCEADRKAGGAGFCGVGATSSYFCEEILWGEEKPLVPSHEIFFSGCNMRCSYCYSYEGVLDTCHGRPFEPWKFAGIISARRSQGATNLNLIGGEPTVHLPAILRTLGGMTPHVPVVWNSNFFMSEDAMRLLDGVVDLFVGDFRFGNDECARRLAETDNYFATAARNFRNAAASTDVIIRHLLVPGHTECCLLPIARWVSENLPGVPFHIMFQYTPCHRALGDEQIGRTITIEEEQRAWEIVRSFGLNTTRWNRALPNAPKQSIRTDDEQIETTITIGPDGRVGIMRLHGELLYLVELLRNGGQADG